MSNQKTTPAVVELACIQCGAPYPALPGSNGLCPACAQKGSPHGSMRQMRQALCPAARRSLAQDLPRLPPGTAHKGGTRAIFCRYGQKAAGRSRRREESPAAPQAEGQRPRRQAGGAAGRAGQGERPAGKEGTAAPELRKVRAAVWEVMAGAAIPALWPDAGGVPVLPAGQPVKDQLCAGDGAGGLLCRGV